MELYYTTKLFYFIILSEKLVNLTAILWEILTWWYTRYTTCELETFSYTLHTQNTNNFMGFLTSVYPTSTMNKILAHSLSGIWVFICGRLSRYRYPNKYYTCMDQTKSYLEICDKKRWQFKILRYTGLTFYILL